MAERADFIVTNMWDKDISVSLKHNGRNHQEEFIERKVALKGKRDGKELVTYQYNDRKFHVPGPEVALHISPPEGVDIRDCPIQVKSDVDLSVVYSRSKSCWVINIVPSDLPPTAPATTNVNVGEDKPG